MTLTDELTEGAKKALTEKGYAVAKMPGRGRSKNVTLNKDGRTVRACIRTTTDRWLMFMPYANATKWRTLDEVDVVVLAATDSKEAPKQCSVYMFPAEEVRRRLDENVAARVKANNPPRDDFFLCVDLDAGRRRTEAESVGSGIIEQFDPIATFTIRSLAAGPIKQGNDLNKSGIVSAIMGEARRSLAAALGVQVDAVELDLRIKY
jgi:hypothetical protein